ncbi:MAG TPA: hypothetical protein VFH21_05035 [Burkholderiales bacterium]|nr:hypothetical protein [Burkholderiales bacterium]
MNPIRAFFGQWAGKLPLALHGVPAVGWNDSLYVLGGSERAGAIVNHGRVFMRRE